MSQLEIIYTSVNQSDIFICVFSILKKKMSSYEQLYYLFNQVVLFSLVIFLQNLNDSQAIENFITSVLMSAFKNSQAVTSSAAIFLQNSNDSQAVKNFTASVSASVFKNSQNAKSISQQISKIIVFVNDRRKIAAVINYLKNYLLEKDYIA